MRILITGATGMLGSALIEQWPQAEDELVALSRAEVDLTALRLIDHLMALRPFDAIVHAAALSRVADCQRQPDLAYRTNVEATAVLGRYACEQQIPLIFTSTDMVFDGEQGQYRTTDQPAPRTVYGQTKWTAEQQLLAVYPQATIVRLSLLLRRGWGFLSWLESEWQAGRTTTIFSDQFRTPLLVADAVRALAQCLQQPRAGLLHLAGPQRVNRMQIAAGFAERLGMPLDLLATKTRAEANLSYPVEHDLSLVTSPEFASLPLCGLDQALDQLV
ncbi:SDR family oxidoreductase [Leptolyngbya sp. FACHB-261]|uniref:SDR family oxidoreductase n=1 Tax=Leptolyngbya sp. FACHB-261 TaxID=2692806 RepID=UPI001687C403|nr:SDR family oxidoreductase [Leptolyngbya sp. FACHB-261]MBD2099395.1 SDR family oxidoreductase [Leptolyngbya sp. FACHB-261]